MDVTITHLAGQVIIGLCIVGIFIFSWVKFDH